MKDLGFFISPVGKIIPVGGNGTHIGTVIAHPSKFGLKKADIEKAYKKHKERLGIEGDAREEILKRLTKKGWIRLRRYPQYWSIQFARMNTKVMKTIAKFTQAILKGVGRYKEADKYIPIIAMGFDDGYMKTVELDYVAQTGTFNESIEMIRIEDHDITEMFLAEVLDMIQVNYDWSIT
ncbi:MAG: hypothetical protein HN616_02605 [Proteobacteria bacterium]|nr:hypothetical protein [Pseudomonadota bacterium]